MGGQVLLNRGRGEMALKILHEGGDVEGFVGKLKTNTEMDSEAVTSVIRITG